MTGTFSTNINGAVVSFLSLAARKLDVQLVEHNECITFDDPEVALKVLGLALRFAETEGAR